MMANSQEWKNVMPTPIISGIMPRKKNKKISLTPSVRRASYGECIDMEALYYYGPAVNFYSLMMIIIPVPCEQS